MKQDWRIDPIVLLLFFGIFATLGLMVFVDFKFKEDGQTFQVISSLVGALTGAFLLRIKPQAKEDPSPGTTEIKRTTTATVEVTPPVDK